MASEKFEKFLKLVASQPRSDRVNIEKMRINQDRVGGKFPQGVVGTPVDVDGIPAEWIDNQGADPDRAVLYLHGGGYVAGSIDSHRNLTGHLAKAMGCRVLALHYRLAPEHPHPASVEDAVKAYNWLLDQGFDAAHLMIAGDSAGGGLTLAALLALRAAGVALPATATAISPWTDMEGLGESMQSRAAVDPMVQRDGLPPLLIHVGDHEVLLDDSTRFAAKAQAAGVDVTLEVWPEMIHVWHASAGYVPESDRAIARIAEYSRPKLGL